MVSVDVWSAIVDEVGGEGPSNADGVSYAGIGCTFGTCMGTDPGRSGLED